MTSARKFFVRVVGPACLTTVAGGVHAQDPHGPSLLPAPPIAIAPQVGCVPGTCTHRTHFGRLRCKRKLQEAFLGFPEEFERPALGGMMHAANAPAIANAEAASMILYQYDFEPGTAKFNLRGRDKLGEIGSRLPSTFYPAIVERPGIAALDETRRRAVFGAFASGPFPIPIERVLIGRSAARGMSGEEAILIHQATVARAALAGPPIGVGSDTSSSPSTAR